MATYTEFQEPKKQLDALYEFLNTMENTHHERESLLEQQRAELAQAKQQLKEKDELLNKRETQLMEKNKQLQEKDRLLKEYTQTGHDSGREGHTAH